MVSTAPGPRGHPLLGVLPERQRLGDLRLWVGAWRRYGDVVRARLGPLVVHLVVRPEHIRYVLAPRRQNYVKGSGYAGLARLVGNGLVTSEGELWQRQRRLMQPPFTPHSVGQFAQPIVGAAEELADQWRERIDRPIDVRADMHRLTLTVLGVTMF